MNMSLESAPAEHSESKQVWRRERIFIQAALMEKMGIDRQPDDAGKEQVQKEESQWVKQYAEKFANLTDQNHDLQQRLMSEEEVVRDSAIQEVIELLQQDDE